MRKDLNKNEIEIAIAEINHNLEYVIETQEQVEKNMKEYFTGEKRRLTELLNKFIKLRDEVDKYEKN